MIRMYFQDLVKSVCSPVIADIVFEIGLGMSCIFFCGYMFTGFAIAKIGKKTLLGMNLQFICIWLSK